MDLNIRDLWEKADYLDGRLATEATSHLAARRRYKSDEDPLSMDNLFISDKAKILSSKAFRNMAKKTQVFTLKKNPLIRSRLGHVMEVVATSIVASEKLGLNTDLVEAAALGHDMGHVPFGHQGEMWMQSKMMPLMGTIKGN